MMRFKTYLTEASNFEAKKKDFLSAMKRLRTDIKEEHCKFDGDGVHIDFSHELLTITSQKVLDEFKKINVKSLTTHTLHVENAKITSLIGCPRIVNGNVEISDTLITSIKGCPEKISGSLVLLYNDNLKSLANMSQVDDITIESCKSLKSLVGLPESVDYLYLENLNIKSLKGCPRIVNSNFTVHACDITSMIGCPSEVGGQMTVSLCDNLISFENTLREVGNGIAIKNCSKLKSLHRMPSTDWLEILNCHSLENLSGMKNLRDNCTIQSDALESLEGMCDEIGGDLILRCKNLKNLRYLPFKIGRLLEVDATEAKLGKKDIPKTTKIGDGAIFY